MSRFKDLIKNRTLLCDGAMGTMLQEAGLAPGECPELLNVHSPERVRSVHRAYIDAGADIIETNTFGGSRVKLSSFGLEDRTEELNEAAVRVAKEASSGDALVAGSVGPTGRFLHPVGELGFDEAVSIFAQQAAALAGAGADLIILETFSDIKEIRTAVIGAREVTDIPVVALMTFEPSALTLLGSSPEAAAVTLEAVGADAVGSNCGLGPEGILEVLRRMATVTELPLVAMPNAGMPRLEHGRTVFPASPEEMVQPFGEFLGIGTALLGGCCGTSPAHIARMRRELDTIPGRSDRILTDPSATRLSSRSSVLFVGGASPIRAIGERLNPTGRKTLAQAVREGRFDPYREEAARQVEAGAQMLDVNVGVPNINEEQAMEDALTAVGQVVSVPLVIDSPRPEVIEAGLKAVDGKALINSVTGEDKSLEKILPLAKKYGAAVLGLTLDGNGIPDTAEGRLAIARRIHSAALKAGIPGRDVLIDCLTLSAGAEQERVAEALRTVSLIRKELGLNTLLGVSNISYGLPSREFLNAAFLSMAARAGLSAAIVNPFDKISMGLLAASRVILNQDRHAADYISLYGGGPSTGGTVSTRDDEDREGALGRAVVNGHPEKAGELAVALLDQGYGPMEIGEKILIPAMSEVGERFARNDYFLPQVLMSAKAMQSAFKPLREAMKGQDLPSAGRILMATVAGDIHDIGKNIVITLLENHGFEVLDLGKNVPSDELVREASRPGVDAVGLSALMTTTMVHMKNAVKALRAAGLEVPVVVGGAAVTQEYAGEIGADGYAGDATGAVKVFLELLHRNR
ncbi:MAG: homocysteine S-methyltransferase family protein [bacterium]|nr:homocysteine S-methyltransferase family protein [bacterium]MDT8396795.1 homocysteine S-methyltransferase family protein [bacterium]